MFIVTLPILCLLIVVAFAAVAASRQTKLPATPSCGACDYGVPHDEAQVCPECGERYVIVGLRSSLYDPVSVWRRATSRGAAYIVVVVLLSIAALVLVERNAGRDLSFHWQVNLSIGREPSFDSQGQELGKREEPWQVDFDVNAAGPALGVPRSAFIVVRTHPRTNTNASHPSETAELRIDAMAGHYESRVGSKSMGTGPFVPHDTFSDHLNRVGWLDDPELRALLVSYVDSMVASATTRTTDLQTAVWGGPQNDRLKHWRIAGGTGGGSSSSASASANTLTFACIFALLVAAIGLWAMTWRNLLRADKRLRTKLISELQSP